MKRIFQSAFIQHVIFWSFYMLFCSGRDMAYYPHFMSNLFTNILIFIPLVPLVYINLYVLVQRYLMKKRVMAYLLSLGGLIMLFTWITILNYDFIFGTLYGLEKRAEFFTSWRGNLVILTEVLLLLYITMALYFIQQWYVKERYARELEKKNLEGELQLLKYQMQPHFLFNTLNAIYMLMERNTQTAKEALLQFSDVLSHTLYDAQKDRITLEQELEYLRNYLEIEQLRNEGLLELEFNLPDPPVAYQLAPMLLIPFIENAFKHGKSAKGYWIKLDLEVEGQELRMQLKNPMHPKAPKALPTKGGIGLVNVKRRLKLLYPEKHQLEIDQSDNVFAVQLTIPLEPVNEAQAAKIKLTSNSIVH
ncbi:MAG: histidine kinase [Bacteroidota bacterium]